MPSRILVAALVALVAIVSQGQDLCAQNSGIGINKVLTLKPGQSETMVQGIDLTPINDVLSVEFPPTVHIHRMYFSKAETIQGPIVEGGRYMIVARHPITNKTVYVDAMLPEGAPRIRYEPKRIVYIYPDEHIHVEFTRPRLNGNEGAKLVYGKGRGATDRLQTFRSNLRDNIDFRVSRSRFLNATKVNAAETKKFFQGTAETFARAGEKLNNGLRDGINNLPGVNRLKTLGDGRIADRERSAADLFSYFQREADRDRPLRSIR